MLQSKAGRKLKSAAKYGVGAILASMPVRIQTKFKEMNELLFWKIQLKKSDGKYFNEHIEYFYTNLFYIDKSYYSNKKILDIGCGPVGSLEWATNAMERIGLDPLADEYLKLNNGIHKMRYVKGYSESIPFSDDYFDVTTIFNALDHVSDLQKSIEEAVRVTKAEGDILVVTEINHAPTITEPHFLPDDIHDRFSGCRMIQKQVFGINASHNLYGSILDQEPYPRPGSVGIICFRLRKNVKS